MFALNSAAPGFVRIVEAMPGLLDRLKGRHGVTVQERRRWKAAQRRIEQCLSEAAKFREWSGVEQFVEVNW